MATLTTTRRVAERQTATMGVDDDHEADCHKVDDVMMVEVGWQRLVMAGAVRVEGKVTGLVRVLERVKVIFGGMVEQM